jgi:hypothetical protein
MLFTPRTALWYIEQRPLGQGGQAAQGGSYYIADNPPYGAVFTYHLADGLTTLEKARREAEKKLEKEWKDTPYVGWDELEKERRQPDPAILLTVRDADGSVVRTIEGPAKKGFHRVAWDLRYPTTAAIREPSDDEWRRGPADPNSGFMAPPGSYTVTLSKRVDGEVTDLSGAVAFEVKRVFPGVLEGTPPLETAAYMAQVAALNRAVTAASEMVQHGFKRVDNLERGLARSQTAPGGLDSELEAFKQKLYRVDELLNGNRSLGSMGEVRSPTISGRLRNAAMTDGMSDYGPTATHRRSLEIATEQFAELEPRIRQLLDVELPALEAKMEAAGVPWTPGRPLPEVN